MVVEKSWIFFVVLAVCNASGNGIKNEKTLSFRNCAEIDVLSHHIMKILHDELDKDDDGSVTASEGVKYVLGATPSNGGNSKSGTEKNLSGFENDKDGRITPQEFWDNWYQSPVYNWTMSEMVDWLTYDVELPQYAVNFHVLNVTGCIMPILANNGSVVLQIVDFSKENKLKLMLKAKEAVLLGPGKRKSTWIKDVFMTLSLMLAMSGIAYGVKVQRAATHDVQMMQEKFSKLQNTLKTLEDDEIWYKQLPQQDDEKSNQSDDSLTTASELVTGCSDLETRLRDVEVELKHTRDALRDAEHRLKENENNYRAPTKLRALLRTTYDNEMHLVEVKREQVQRNVEAAKNQFLKMKRNRTSLLGMIQFVHSKQADNLDYEVQNTSKMIVDFQRSSKDRVERWRSIEKVSSCKIIHSISNKRDLNANKEIIMPKSTQACADVSSDSSLESVIESWQSTSSLASKPTTAKRKNPTSDFSSSASYSVLTNQSNDGKTKLLPHAQSQTFPRKSPRPKKRMTSPRSESSKLYHVAEDEDAQSDVIDGLRMKKDLEKLDAASVTEEAAVNALHLNNGTLTRPRSCQSLQDIKENVNGTSNEYSAQSESNKRHSASEVPILGTDSLSSVIQRIPKKLAESSGSSDVDSLGSTKKKRTSKLKSLFTKKSKT